MTLSTATVDRLLWAAHDDTLRGLLPHLGTEALAAAAADLRAGSGGRWERLPPDCEARRRLLLADVAAAWQARAGGTPWPFPDDLLPEIPDHVPDHE